MGLEKNAKIKRPVKKQLLLLLPFAFCYAFFIVLGDWQGSAAYSNAQNVGRLVVWAAVSFGVLLAAGFLLENGARVARRVGEENLPYSIRMFPEKRPRQGGLRIWFLFFSLCLLCYLPYFLVYYPTWLNNDAVWQMEQALGHAAKSNHHPYFHTLIIKFFLTVGYSLSHDYSAAAALYTFFQMALTAAVFGFFLYLLYRRGTRVLWLALAAVFYALLPVNGMYSICMGKDAWFTAFFLLFMWVVSACAARRQADRRLWVLFFVTGLSVCLLRSNGIFIFAGTVFFLLLSQLAKWRETDGRFRRRMCLSAAAVLLCYVLWQGPVLSLLGVEPPDTIEGLTMPVQHLLCAYVRGGDLTDEEVAMIDAVAPLSHVDEFYNPYLFDITKNYIRENGNQNIIAENKGAYAKLWLRVGLRNPMQYLEAQIRQTAGYYALHIPHEQMLYSEYFMVDNPFGIENARKVFSYDAGLAMGEFLQWFQKIYNSVWSLGANTWLLLFAMACALYRGRSCLVYVPCLMLLGSLFLAAPVYNEFRYAYGVFAALPFLLASSFGKE